MHVTLPGLTDPTNLTGSPINCIGKIGVITVGVQGGFGSMSILPFKSVNAWESGSKPVGVPIEYQAGDGVIPPLYGIPAANGHPAVPGLMDNDDFAAAWGTIGYILLGYVAAHRNGTVVAP